VADEIENQNLIRVSRRAANGCIPAYWTARVGPDPGGLAACGFSGADAVRRLAIRLLDHGWIFDPSWEPMNADCDSIETATRETR